MRLTLACVAALAVFASCHATKNKHTADIPAMLPSARVKTSEGEVTGKFGDHTTPDDIVQSYISFLTILEMHEAKPDGKLPTVENVETGMTQDKRLPTVENVKTALEENKKYDEDSSLCKMGYSGVGGSTQEWYQYLCF